MPAQKIFNKYAVPKTQLDYTRSIFNYERTHSTNMLTGRIVPVGILHLQPGDTPPNKFGFVLQSAPLNGPSLDNVYIDVISVWTPLRLALGNFNEWLGDNDTYVYTLGNNVSFPKITTVNTKNDVSLNPTITRSKSYYAEHYLGPHIGFRFFSQMSDFSSHTRADSRYHNGINVMASRIYDLNWNRLFRNENVQPPILFSKQAGTDLSLDVQNYGQGLGVLHKANRLKNIFTTAWPTPAIQTADLGLNGLIQLPVYTGDTHKDKLGTVALKWVYGLNGQDAPDGTHYIFSAKSYTGGSTLPAGSTTIQPDNLWADLSTLTVNSMYYALMLQRYYNKATLGRRPVEFYKTFFGVSSSQAAYDDPQLLSQKRFKVNISRVVATSNSADAQSNTQPLGTQGAFSVTSVGGTLFPEFTATEYGQLQIYAVIRTQESFSSGIDRHLTDGELLETYIPTFDHIGPDYIEIGEFMDYVPANVGNSAIIFGYQNAWYHYRYAINDVVGIMSPGEPLDYFTLARNFSGSSPISINSAFIEQSPFEIDRMLQFPVFNSIPGSTGVDSEGEPYNSNVYQWLIQFALVGQFARTMSKDSEPLML